MAENRTENSISSADADKLIAAHDGDVALLYIYYSRSGCTDRERAAHDLCRTLKEISSAEEKLSRMGLIPGGAAPAPAAEEKLPPEEVMPEYTAEDIVRRSREDEKFSVILAEAKGIFGRNLNSSDMKMLFGIYDYLALPAEVILELLNYCAETAREKSPGKRPSPRSVEQEAYRWANREILTLEQAEEYIRRQKSLREASNRVKEALGIRGRELTPTETKYITSWLGMGFEQEAILIAYDRTVTSTGSLKWPYMNKIICSWHEKKLHTPEEIEAGDGRKRPAQSQPAQAGVDMAELEKINRVIDRELPDCIRETLLVLDSSTGQNAVIQAQEFGNAARLTGIVLTKLDGTAKGGIIISIRRTLGIPVKFIGVGEKVDDLQKFDPQEFVRALFGE